MATETIPEQPAQPDTNLQPTGGEQRRAKFPENTQQNGAKSGTFPGKYQQLTKNQEDDQIMSGRQEQRVQEEVLDDEESEWNSRLRNESVGVRILGDLRVLDIDERRGKAGLRLLQSKAYVELVEDRLLDVEEKLQKLLDLPKPTYKANLSKPPASKPEIIELDWVTFRGPRDQNTEKGKLNHRPEIDEEEKCVIEVLTEEPQYIFLPATRNGGPPRVVESSVKHSARSSTAQLGDQNCSPDTPIHQGLMATPYRIRIRSPLLLKVINEITGFSTTRGPHKHTLLFFRPFKLLVARAEDLQNHLAQMNKVTLSQSKFQSLLNLSFASC